MRKRWRNACGGRSVSTKNKVPNTEAAIQSAMQQSQPQPKPIFQQIRGMQPSNQDNLLYIFPP